MDIKILPTFVVECLMLKVKKEGDDV